MKIHFAHIQRANESDNTEYVSKTFCGLESTNSPCTDNKNKVTCQRCLMYLKNYNPFDHP